MNFKEELLSNIDKIHTTRLGISRIKNNLEVDDEDVVSYCIQLIKQDNSTVKKKGKNYYVNIDNKEITVNSSSFTIITAHIKKKVDK